MTGGGTDEMSYSWSVDDAMCLTELCASESGKLDCPVASFNPHPSAGPKSSSSSIRQSCKGRQSQSRLQGFGYRGSIMRIRVQGFYCGCTPVHHKPYTAYTHHATKSGRILGHSQGTCRPLLLCSAPSPARDRQCVKDLVVWSGV